MDKVILASMHPSAGKTSIAVGIAKALGGKIGYMKPFGDRPIYRKKRLWDYDTALMTNVFGLEDAPEDMCFGFDHSKLKYMYSLDGTRDKLLEAAGDVGRGKDLLLIEGGRDLMYGTYVHLGALSLAKHTGAKLIVVVSGDSDSVVDDVAFLKKYLYHKDFDFGGVIINKVKDVADFKKTHLPQIKGLGVDVVGVLPHLAEMSRMSVAYLAEMLFAKVITGEANLDRAVENVLIGAMAVDTPLQKIFAERKNKLVIASGDRSDMILAALESDTEAILLTNDILPQPRIISKAEEKGVPMLMVPWDTFKAAKMVDDLEPLLTKDQKDSIDLLGQTVKKNLDLKKIVG